MKKIKVNADIYVGDDKLATMKDITKIVDTVKDINKLSIYDGLVVQTLGFYNLNDGGGAKYKIVETPKENEKPVLQLKNNLVGILISEFPVNMKKLGVSENLEDNSDIIQNALDMYGGVYLPKGKYKIGKTIKINSENKLSGDGDGTILKLSNNSNCDIICCDSCNHYTISDIRIDGNKNNNSSGNGIVIKSANPMSMWSIIENVFVENCAENGLVEKLNPWQITVAHCTFSDCKGYGILNEATDVIFETVYISNCKGGFKELGSSNKLSNIKISGSGLFNTVDDYDLWGHGFLMINSSRDMLTNVEVQENKLHGFKLLNCSDITFSSCCSDRNGLIIHSGDSSNVWAGLFTDGCERLHGDMIIQNYRNDGTQKYGLLSNNSEIYMDLIVRNCELYYNFTGNTKINSKINGEILNNRDKGSFPSVDVYENILNLINGSVIEYETVNNGFISVIGSSSEDDAEISVSVYDSDGNESYGDSRVVNNGKIGKILVPVERGVKVKITRTDKITLTKALFIYASNVKI